MSYTVFQALQEIGYTNLNAVWILMAPHEWPTNLHEALNFHWAYNYNMVNNYPRILEYAPYESRILLERAPSLRNVDNAMKELGMEKGFFSRLPSCWPENPEEEVIFRKKFTKKFGSELTEKLLRYAWK